MLSSPLPPASALHRRGLGRRRCCSFRGSCFSRGLRLGLRLGLLLGKPRIHFRRLGGMNLVKVLVGLGQLLAIQQQAAKAVGRRQLKLRVHLDRLKRADFHADLAAHAH